LSYSYFYDSFGECESDFLQSGQIFVALTFSDYCKSITVNKHFSRLASGVIVAAHGKAIRTGGKYR